MIKIWISLGQSNEIRLHDVEYIIISQFLNINWVYQVLEFNSYICQDVECITVKWLTPNKKLNTRHLASFSLDKQKQVVLYKSLTRTFQEPLFQAPRPSRTRHWNININHRLKINRLNQEFILADFPALDPSGQRSRCGIHAFLSAGIPSSDVRSFYYKAWLLFMEHLHT